MSVISDVTHPKWVRVHTKLCVWHQWRPREDWISSLTTGWMGTRCRLAQHRHRASVTSGNTKNEMRAPRASECAFSAYGEGLWERGGTNKRKEGWKNIELSTNTIAIIRCGSLHGRHTAHGKKGTGRVGDGEGGGGWRMGETRWTAITVQASEVHPLHISTFRYPFTIRLVSLSSPFSPLRLKHFYLFACTLNIVKVYEGKEWLPVGLVAHLRPSLHRSSTKRERHEYPTNCIWTHFAAKRGDRLASRTPLQICWLGYLLDYVIGEWLCMPFRKQPVLVVKPTRVEVGLYLLEKKLDYRVQLFVAKMRY